MTVTRQAPHRTTNQRMHAESSSVSRAMVAQFLGPGDPGRSSMKMKQSIGYPIVVALIVIVAFSNANAYVWRLQIHRPWQNFSSVSADTLWQDHSMRGWPISVDLSSEFIADGSRSVVHNARFSAPLELATIWARDASDITRLNGVALAINLVVCILVVMGCFFAASAICRKTELTLRFSLRSLLVVTAICSVVFAIHEDILVIQSLFNAVNSLPDTQAILSFGALGAIYTALCVAFVWFIVIIWQRTVHRRRNTDCDEPSDEREDSTERLRMVADPLVPRYP